MPVKLIPIEPPGDIDPDDPLGLLSSTSEASKELAEASILGRAGRVVTNIVRALDWNPDLHPRNRLGQFIETPDAPEAYRPPSVSEVPQVKLRGEMYGMASPSAKTVVPQDGPRYPKNADSDNPNREKRAGQVIRPGQTVAYKGQEWEVSHIVDGHLVLDEASGKKSKAQTLVIGPEDRSPDGSIPGLTVGKPREVQGGKGLNTGSIRVVSPYVEPKTHNPDLKIPEGSEINEDEWRRFGLVEQLHYIDLMGRFGAWKASGQAIANFLDAPVGKLIDELLEEFDDEIVQIVRSANLSQKGASTTNTLSLTSLGSTNPNDFEKREKAMELQQRLNDIIAWDLYNRLRSPDILSFHGDSSGKAASWWKNLFAKGSMFSGLSQTFNADFAASWGHDRVIATPLSIRHLVMATFVTNWFGGGYASEREISIVSRMKADDRTMILSWSDIGPEARQWLSSETGTPRSGALLETLKDHLDNDTDLPIVVPPDLNISSPDTPPPPKQAVEAMAEYGALPEIQGNPYEPAELAKLDLPFRKLDENGNPVPEVAADAGLEPGDFMLGLKGTLYWLGPNPNPDTGFPLVYHKIIQESDGSLVFTGESYGFENSGGNEYYFLKGNVPPVKPKEAPDFDPGAWAFANEDPMRIADMPLNTKFKVNGKTYEKIEESQGAKTRVLDLETGGEGTINSKYETVRLMPGNGAFGQTVLEPVKGLTLSYEGKKHTITSVKKDGTISLKPSGGGNVVKLSPDDISLENLFDPSQWEIGEQTKLGNLKVGELFQGGQGQQTIKPYRVLDIEGNKVQWQNLDTGEKGSSTLKKTVRKLDPTEGSAGEAEVSDDPPTPTPEAVAVADEVADAETPSAVDIPTAPLTGYKSKWGSGGKYKHDPIADLSVGTVFQDKGGNQFMIVNSGDGPSDPITITDGSQTFTVSDTSIRVRALPDAPPLATPDPDGEDDAAPQENQQGAVSLPPIKADNIDALPEADLLPYKSKWGSGGKYTHDKIAEMPTGTVFQDKNGKMWKVQSNDPPTAVITDGEQNFKVDGNLRGRAKPGKELTGPPPPITDKPYGTGNPIPGIVTPDDESAAGYDSGGLLETAEMANIGGVGQMPKNTLVSFDGGENTYIVTGEEVAPGTALLLPAGGTKGGPIGKPSDAIPTHIKAGPITEQGAPKSVIQKDMVDNSQPIPDVLSDQAGPVYFQVAGLVYSAERGDNGAWQFWIVRDDGVKVWIKDSSFPKPNLTPDKVLIPPSSPSKAAPTPAPDEQDDILITNLGSGDEFEVEIDGSPVKYEVVAVGQANSWVKDSMTGEVLTLDNDDQPTPQTVAAAKAALQPAPEKAPAYPGGGGAAVAELQALTFDEIKELPAMPIKFYKSKWGSGGKYKHDFLSDLAPGDRFTPSGTTDEYILVKSVGGGVVLIYKPSDGTYGIADGQGRVRKV